MTQCLKTPLTVPDEPHPRTAGHLFETGSVNHFVTFEKINMTQCLKTPLTVPDSLTPELLVIYSKRGALTIL